MLQFAARYRILLFTSVTVFIVDIITKSLILNYFDFGDRVCVIPGFFDLVHFSNTGAAFGIFSSWPDIIRIPFFYVMALVAVIFSIWYYRSIPCSDKLQMLAISLIFGGIAGNIFDRIRFGSVVDFISFHVGYESWNFVIFGKHVSFYPEWPAFNIADSAITVAAGLLVWRFLFSKKNKASSFK